MSIRYDRDDRSGATAMAPWGHREDGQTGFLPAATIIEQPPVPTPAESMAAFPTDRPRTEYPDPDNSWGLEPRMGVIDNADSGRSLPSAPLLPPAPSVTRLSRPRLTRRGSGQELRGAGGGVGRACVLRRRGRRQRRGGAHAAIRSHHQLPIAHSESYAPLRSPARRPSRTLTSRRCPALCCAQGLTERRSGPTRRRCFLWSCTPPYLPPSPPALIWPWPECRCCAWSCMRRIS